MPLIGKVIWFNDKKGYGFIKADEGRDVFVHRTNIEGMLGYKTLFPDMQVSFELVEHDRGPRAECVRSLVPLPPFSMPRPTVLFDGSRSDDRPAAGSVIPTAPASLPPAPPASPLPAPAVKPPAAGPESGKPDAKAGTRKADAKAPLKEARAKPAGKKAAAKKGAKPATGAGARIRAAKKSPPKPAKRKPAPAAKPGRAPARRSRKRPA